MARRSVSLWEDYDPRWLVEAAKLQRPDLPWLAIAFGSCNRVLRRRHGDDECLYFVDPSRPNEPGSEWQFADNVVIHAEEMAECIVVDILTENRVGGIELLR